MRKICGKRICQKWPLTFLVFRQCLPIQNGYLAGIHPLYQFYYLHKYNILSTGSIKSTKLLLSDRRNRLGDDIIEASECLKSWAEESFIYGGPNSDVNRMQSTLKALELYTVGLRSSSVV